MVRARSRDFLLTICGVLLLGIFFVTIIVNLAVKVEEISQNERKRQILKNIEVTFESIAITGKGNFLKIGPKYEELVISEFNTKFMKKDDKVSYTMRLCNNNSEDVFIQGISIGQKNCSDRGNKEMDCRNIIIKKDFYDDDNNVLKNVYLKKNTCMNAKISLEYVGEDLDDEIRMHIEQFSFNIKTLEK